MTEVGIFAAPLPVPRAFAAGDVGYVAASIKNVRDAHVGDDRREPHGRNGAARVQEDTASMVFCRIYPADGAKYDLLRDSLEKLQLNDASVSFEPETSLALGFGSEYPGSSACCTWRSSRNGWREYDLDLVTTAPSVVYRVRTLSGEERLIDNPASLPEPTTIEVYGRAGGGGARR